MRPRKYYLGISKEDFLKVATIRNASVMVNEALKWGVITEQPCEVCGKKAVAHHPDYTKPIDVQWLCQKHHMEEHRRLKSTV